MRHLASPPLIALSFAALLGCGDSGGAGGGGAGGGGAGGGAGGNAGACVVDADCASTTGNAVCIYADGLCGEGAPKSCVEIAATCGESPAETYCTCDGASAAASTACQPQRDERPGACTPPADRFYCGAIDCALGTEFCDLVGGTNTCGAIPDACVDADDLCVCLGYEEGGGCECRVFDDGHVEVGCYL